MAIPEQRDPAVTRSQLTKWLAQKLPGSRQVWVSEISGPGATGFSNETILFDARWADNAGQHQESLVARVKPSKYSIFLDPQFEEQYKVMDLLVRHTEIPLPPTYWYEADEWVLGSPFYVMAKVDGLIPADIPPYTIDGWVHEATPAQREKMYWSGLGAMSQIHMVDWRALGLGFLDHPERGQLGFDQQLDYYRESLEWASAGQPVDVARTAYEWLVDNRPDPADDPPVGLLWGDARPANMIFSDFECAAVLDWEMTTLGPAEIDLSWWLFLDRHWTEGIGVSPLTGFPTRSAVIAKYEEQLGRTMRHLEYYEVFAGLRFAVIMMRITQMGLLYELFPPDTDMLTNNIPTHLLAKRFGLPPPGPSISFS